MDERIVIAGAGSIGCFVGGLLAAAGREVTFLCRPRIAEELGQAGLTLTSFEGWTERLMASQLRLEVDPQAALSGATLILVTVKSGATEEMARLIDRFAPKDAPVVSLQNGLGNADTLRRVLGNERVLAGMVPFNVVARGQGRFHKGTSGHILIDSKQGVMSTLNVLHLPVEGSPDMRPVLAGKLLLNLNNALNALSGMTLYEQLGDRRWRRVLASCQAEALGVFAAASIEPWSMGPLPAKRLPQLLRLPTFLFRLLARSAVRIDRSARSSMWEDLERRRPTEINELQGRIVAMAERLGRDAPVNRAVLDLVLEAEKAGKGSPLLHPETLSDSAS